ncbi:aliphatic nitrilase [Acuticoccus sediminis]|uniref:Aliphatic nitrilase n=1 Tax=Acuticoccus sediminis TaxID=2184697 RepID=A0A8B2NXD9_9HYPH|nr:carbon-nitrogen hydrolase family protein [Acuticoccus sediminis]RAI02473.1 aliphatic nitrilase [Acuticoccus sediminis]
MLSRFRAASVHAAPIFLDRAATLEKAISLIREAARNGAELIAFPETFIPAFPVWAALFAPIDTHDLFERMADQSVRIDGPEIQRLREEARANGVVVSMGISERSPVSVGGLWNSFVLIGDDGSILNHHRKLVPTYFEKLIWSNGDGAGLKVVETRLGRIGQLICGENTNPLARFSLMAQGEQFHISSWPAVWPTRRPKVGGNYHIANAARIRAAAHSFEAKVFGLVTAGVLGRDARDMLVDRDPAAADVIDGTPRASSFFIDPTGEQMGEALTEDEGIVYADIDLNRCVEPKQFHDLVGYYNRFDIFDLTVHRERLQPATFEDVVHRDPAPALPREGAENDRLTDD